MKETYLETSNWSGEIEKFILPELEIGSHVVSITATDSKGNQKIENFPLIIFPNRGVDFRSYFLFNIGRLITNW